MTIDPYRVKFVQKQVNSVISTRPTPFKSSKSSNKKAVRLRFATYPVCIETHLHRPFALGYTFRLHF